LVPVKGEMEPITTGSWAMAEISEIPKIRINAITLKKLIRFIIPLLSFQK
jgi:hypothetical protein